MFAKTDINDYCCRACLPQGLDKHLYLTVWLPEHKCPQCGRVGLLYNHKVLRNLKENK